MRTYSFIKSIIFSLFLILFLLLHQFCSKKNEEPPEPTGDAPVAAFITDVISLVEGETVQFTDQSTNTPTSWLWDFGDGNTSLIKNPTHTYVTNGDYTVTLTATNNFGTDTETKEDLLHVISEEQVGVSDAFVDIEENNGTIDDFNLDNGTVTISFTGEAPSFQTGSVLTIDMDTMGYLRKVVSMQKSSSSVVLQTEPAFFTDVFVDRDFNLKTDLYEPSIQLKSTSPNTLISRALTDAEGYIHPVEIIYHHKNGEITKKSALDFKSDGPSGNYDMINFTKDFSNTDLYGEKDGDAHFYIQEGELTFVSDAVFEFDFEYEGELVPNTQIKKGDLNSFKFYLDSDVDFITKLALDLKKSEEESDEHELYKMPKVTAKFMVGTVPVWISFECKVVGKYELKADAALHADWGFESSQTLKSGGIYTKDTDDFEPIMEYTPTNISYPLNMNGEINLTSKVEIYPKVEMMFYNFFGPTAELSTYVEEKFNSKFQTELTTTGSKEFLAWNSGLDIGLDFKLGSKLTFLWGLYDKEFGPQEYNCYKNAVWEAPYVIELLSEEVPEEAFTDSNVNLSFEVKDNFDNPIVLCPITLKGDGSVSEGIVFTDAEGKAAIEWTMPSTAKENKLTATIYKADKTEVDKVEVTVKSVIEEKLAAVTTAPVALVTDSSAYCGGTITDDGNATIIAAGVCWSTDETPTTDDFITIDDIVAGEYLSSLTDLTFNTTYYVRAYVTNTKGTAYGEQIEFKTKDIVLMPTVTTTDLTEITSITATGGGEVLDDGNVTISERGVCWSLNEQPTIDDNKTSDGSGEGTFTSNLDNLEANTAYYVKAYASSEDSTVYGEQKQFTTEEQAGLPMVTTADISGISDTEATSGGEVSDDGGDAVTAYGVCWSTNEAPTIDGNITNDGSGTGAYTSTLTGLFESTTYFVRAYATNSVGTAYGEQKQFTSAQRTGFSDPRDGQKYDTVHIGNQVWFAENLNYNTEDSYVYNNNASNAELYGRLYLWEAAVNACPEGWRLPSKTDWEELISYLDADPQNINPGSAIRKKTGWYKDSNNITNSTGFSALPGGIFSKTLDIYNNVGHYAYWWTSTNESSTNAWMFLLYYQGTTQFDPCYDKKIYGMSVRCIKND